MTLTACGVYSSGWRSGGASALIVGRHRELARIARVLDDALAGRGRLVLCTGEAGIGKTRLAEEAAALAEAGARLWRGPGRRIGAGLTAVRPVADGAG